MLSIRIVLYLAEAARERGELSIEEAISLCINLLVAGHFTTADLISSLIYLLLTYPEERMRLDTDPTLWSSAIDEALRLEPPTPLLARVHVEDVTLHGECFEAGDTINVFIASANRDPRKFADPDRFDVGRAPNDHLSFGGGAHFCLGAPLAKAEAEIVVRRLFERRPDLRLIDGAAEWRRSPNFRGLVRLRLSAQASGAATHPEPAQLSSLVAA